MGGSNPAIRFDVRIISTSDISDDPGPRSNFSCGRGDSERDHAYREPIERARRHEGGGIHGEGCDLVRDRAKKLALEIISLIRGN